ncbi:YgjP-like metallopeptidase domain-containing protein [Methanocalculus sp.]|uniref:YgjP-like metallopeptidase domain-containing protein n=1 Tax=Methanocalculus sp. TaxID=2004547 RepID=UPI0027261624|nr:YgjP-like metallopeptidase domain-containing protein [Methanocalculus sp.]MDO8841576.1 DUF45 domain-containing protein [Methanocalculus sp.]
MEGNVTIRGREIRYIIIRSKEKGMKIALLPDRTVEIRAPTRITESEARRFLNHHADWIFQHQRPIAPEIDLPLEVETPFKGEPFIIDDMTVRYTIKIDQTEKYPAVWVGEGREVTISTPKPITQKRAHAYLMKHIDRIREEIFLMEGGWQGGTFLVAETAVPYSVIINKRRRYPCLIIKEYSQINLETPAPMTRPACEAFLNEHKDWIATVFQKNDTSGTFNNGVIEIDGEEIPYYVITNRRKKRISTSIRDDLAIEIRSPTPLPEVTAISIIRDITTWIVDSRKRKKDQMQKRQAPRYQDGETIPFYGRLLSIRHLESDGSISAAIAGDELLIWLPPGLTPDIFIERVRTAVVDAYFSAILPIAGEIAERAAKRIGVPTPDIRFGYQKRRFGSCTPCNGIILNLKLAMAPPMFLEYTIIHEVCHLIERNHQKPFWDLVESVFPDYLIHHKEMQREGMNYVF